jgi:hypothetical protein
VRVGVELDQFPSPHLALEFGTGTASPAMQYKGSRYSLVQTEGAAFRWTVYLKTGELVGAARNRTLALVQVIKAIGKKERQIKAAVRKADRAKDPSDQSPVA